MKSLPGCPYAIDSPKSELKFIFHSQQRKKPFLFLYYRNGNFQIVDEKGKSRKNASHL